MASKALGLTIDVSDNRTEIFRKLFPTALYGGLASVGLLFLNGGGNIEEIATTAAIGAIAYPFSRFVLDCSYWLATNEHLSSLLFVTSFTGAVCGLYCGSKGARPHVLVGALVFSLGAILLEQSLESGVF